MKYLVLIILTLLAFSCARPRLNRAPAMPPVARETPAMLKGFSALIEGRSLEIGHNAIPRLLRRDNLLFYITLDGYYYQVNLNTLESEGDIRINEGIRGTPVMNYPLLFFSTARGNEGMPVYDLKRARVIREEALGQSVSSMLLAGDRLMHCAADGRITALTTPSLKTAWSVELGQDIVSDALIEGKNLIVGGRDGRLASYRLRDGQLNWSIDLPDAFYTAPVLSQKALYWAAYSGTVYRVNTGTGEKEQTLPGSVPVYQSPAVNDSLLFVPYGDGRLIAFSQNNGRALWARQLDGPFSAPLLLTANVLYCSQMSEKFYILSLENGTILHEAKLSGRSLSTPLQWKKRLFLFLSPGIIQEYKDAQ